MLAQKAVEGKEEWDVARTARAATFGALWHSPSGRYFYGFLDRMMPGSDEGGLRKVGIDQIAWNPIFGIVFFTSLGLMEGKSTDEIQTRSNDLPTAVTGSWAYWVPAHFVNFRFIPGEQRLLYINCMQIMYNIFLSFLGNRDAPETVAEKKEFAPPPRAPCVNIKTSSTSHGDVVCLLVSYWTLARCTLALDEPQSGPNGLLSLGKACGTPTRLPEEAQSVTCLAPRALPPVKAVL